MKKTPYEYHRILEILSDYWLTEPDELFVKCEMTFVRADGAYQEKTIRWFNPNYKVKGGKNDKKPEDFTLDDLTLKSFAELPEAPHRPIPYLDEILSGKIEKK